MNAEILFAILGMFYRTWKCEIFLFGHEIVFNFDEYFTKKTVLHNFVAAFFWIPYESNLFVP